jgi:hypothetical protein
MCGGSALASAHPTPSTEVVDLGEVFGDDDETRHFAERYFRVQHTDLLFANAALFIEGVAERMLVPLFMELQYEKLNSRYVSFLDIGGSHAHKLKPSSSFGFRQSSSPTSINRVESWPQGQDALDGHGEHRSGWPKKRQCHAARMAQLQNVEDFRRQRPPNSSGPAPRTARCALHGNCRLPRRAANGRLPSRTH